MALVIDNVIEGHEGSEPRVLKSEVRRMLRTVIRPEDEDMGEAVTAVAERANVSTRTVYRVLAPESAGSPPDSITLAISDQLCRSCGTHLALIGARLLWSEGSITPYVSLRGLTLR